MAQRQITAAVAREPDGPFTIEELTLDGPAPDEVLVKITATGVCHTDLTIKETAFPPALPAVLGHEGAGVIAAVGDAAQAMRPDLAAGQPVILSFASCGRCRYCDDGEPAYCDNGPALNYAGGRANGQSALHDASGSIASHFFGQSTFASYACVYPRNIVRAPDDAPLEYLGPMGCAVQTGAGAVINALKAQEGRAMLVAGAGAVGLSAVLAAALQGCDPIIISDPLPQRRALALELGATHALDPADARLDKAVHGIIKRGVDYALDTTGRRDVLGPSVNALGKRGVLASVGIAPESTPTFEVKTTSLMAYGRRIIGVIEGDSDPQTLIPALLNHHLDGRFPFDELITFYPLEAINDAVADQAAGRCVKPVLRMPS